METDPSNKPSEQPASDARPVDPAQPTAPMSPTTEGLPVSPDQAADAVLALMEDPERWASMALAGRQYAGQHTLEAYEERVQAMLEQAWNVEFVRGGGADAQR